MNWDSIKYIFQIPISWYRKIHNRVFNAYGTNFLTVREGFYGGTEIGIDSDGFAEEVQRVSGTVKSVDDVEPDEDGNVELNAVTTDTTQTITANKTFQDASIGFSNDVQGSATNVGDVSSGVSSGVNQVTIEAVNGNYNSGITVGVASNGVTSQLLNNEPQRLYSQGADNQIASRGYVRNNFARASHDHGNISNDGKITQAPGTSTPDYYIAADSNGNLYRALLSSITGDFVTSSQLDTILLDYVTNTSLTTTLLNYVTNTSLSTTLLSYATQSWVQSQGYLTDEDLSDYVTNTDLTTTLADYVTNTSLTTTLADYATQTDIANFVTMTEVQTELLDYVKSVDGHTPNGNGAVSFGLTANKWLKSDANGHIVTTNDTPAVLSSSSSGYLYNNAGTLQYKDDEYVTLATTQTITATKTFNGSDVDVNIVGGQLSVTSSSYASALKDGALVLERSTGAFLDIGPTTNYTQLLNLGGTYGFKISDPYAINLNAPANQATLENHPTETSTSSKAIATVGYCQSHFGSGGGTVTSVDHVSPDAQGNVQLNAIRTINGHNGDSAGNFAGVVTSVNGETPNDGAVTLPVVETVNNTSPDANGNVDVGTVKSVDGHTPDAQGIVSFDLAANKWVKTNSAGQLTTTNDTVITVPSGTTPQTLSSFKVITNVSWNGTQIQVQYRFLAFTNGILTSVSAPATSNIETVAYSS